MSLMSVQMGNSTYQCNCLCHTKSYPTMNCMCCYWMRSTPLMPTTLPDNLKGKSESMSDTEQKAIWKALGDLQEKINLLMNDDKTIDSIHHKLQRIESKLDILNMKLQWLDPDKAHMMPLPS